MEKLVAALWKRGSENRDALNERVHKKLVPALQLAGATNLRANLQDETVSAGAGLAQQFSEPSPDALVQFWLPSGNKIFRQQVDEALEENTGHFALYLVAESTIIPKAEGAESPEGERSAGWSQMALIPLPDRLSRQEFLDVWQDSHTRVAIDTQSNFEYVQNTVLRSLTENAPAYMAIVEECFSLEALQDPYVFFDAVGDETKFNMNLQIMMDSCDRFIDRGRIDVLPTSQFNYG